MSRAVIELNLNLAKQFLATASWAHSQGFHNASHTNAVNAAIRAKDAVATQLAGESRRLIAHGRAVDELANLPGAEELSKALNRILQDKNRFEYGDELATSVRSAEQLARAERFVQKAQSLCFPGQPGQI
ncbi:MAG: hypothetical protein RL068_231 [Actinomycetota bacterium]